MSCHPSNNKYFDCPPRMHDGRNFTDYRPSCDVNNQYVVNGNVLNKKGTFLNWFLFDFQ